MRAVQPGIASAYIKRKQMGYIQDPFFEHRLLFERYREAGTFENHAGIII